MYSGWPFVRLDLWADNGAKPAAHPEGRLVLLHGSRQPIRILAINGIPTVDLEILFLEL